MSSSVAFFSACILGNPQDIWRFLAGTGKSAGHHSPLQEGLMPESEGEKLRTSNNETASEPSYCPYCSAFPTSLAQGLDESYPGGVHHPVPVLRWPPFS